MTGQQTVWVLRQEDEDADIYTWVHASEIGAMKHMKELQGDMELRFDQPMVFAHHHEWDAWVGRLASDSADDDVRGVWSIEQQQVFQ